MNKAQLNRHNEEITKAYEALVGVWADLGVIRHAMGSDNPPADWMVKAIIQRDWDIVGDSLLALTEFIDEINEGKTK